MSTELERLLTVVREGGENLFIRTVKVKDAWTSILARRDKKTAAPKQDTWSKLVREKAPKAPKPDATVLAYGFGNTKEKAIKAMLEEAMRRQGDYIDDMYSRIQRKKHE